MLSLFVSFALMDWDDHPTRIPVEAPVDIAGCKVIHENKIVGVGRVGRNLDPIVCCIAVVLCRVRRSGIAYGEDVQLVNLPVITRIETRWHAEDDPGSSI